MIKVKLIKNNNHIKKIIIKGHAMYADYGKDIVCAAVSTLLQTVGYSLTSREETMTQVDFDYPGVGSVEIGKPTRESHLITGVFELGASMLAEQYPDHVCLEVE